MTAMAKYYATETMRRMLNHGMDVVGGRAVQLGPRNFIALGYQAIPVSITVEGANILSRSLMIFGQGSMRCHPYLFEELQLLQAEDKNTALKTFNDMLFKHLAYTFNRTARAFTYGFTGGSAPASENADTFSRPYYKIINRFSANFALTADMCLGLLAGDIKRKEMLSGRLADIHAQMFIATAILKFYEHGQKTDAEQAHARLALDKALYKTQDAFYDLFENFPIKFASALVKFICFPLGRAVTKPTDQLKRDVATYMMQDNAFRQQLKQHVCYSTDTNDVSGRMESAFQMLLKIEPLWNKFKKAESKGQFQGLTFETHIIDAVTTNFITQSEADQLIAYNIQRYDSMLTDIFDEQLFNELALDNPHLLHKKTDSAQPQKTDDEPEAFLRF